MHPNDLLILLGVLERIAVSLEAIAQSMKQAAETQDGNFWHTMHPDAGKPEFEEERLGRPQT